MYIRHLEIALPILALAALIGLLKLLRHLLHAPERTPGASGGSQALATIPLGRMSDLGPWDRISVRWGRWIAWVLPVPVGLCVLALAAWFLAYLGWAFNYLTDRPAAMAGLPPWFGSTSGFGMEAFCGFVTFLWVGLLGGFLVGIAFLLGRILIWPELCEDDANSSGKRP
ncbi:MAG: hypothetical protein ACREP2_05015 [Rhodanobacteraceae bacterium]